jgi:hypothetical protein
LQNKTKKNSTYNTYVNLPYTKWLIAADEIIFFYKVSTAL